MKENELLSVNQIYHLEVAKLMQKYALRNIPLPFVDIFDDLTRTSRTRTRSNSSIIPGPSTTQKCAQSIRCIGPKIWNALPNEVRFYPMPNETFSVPTPLPLKSFITGMKKYALNEVSFH